MAPKAKVSKNARTSRGKLEKAKYQNQEVVPIMIMAHKVDLNIPSSFMGGMYFGKNQIVTDSSGSPVSWKQILASGNQ